MTATIKLVTAEDLWLMPGDEPWEVWAGELRKVPAAGGEASSIGAVIVGMLFPVVRSSKLGLLTGADGTYRLGLDPDTVVVPDAAFVRWDRLPDGVAPKKYIPVPPDLAVEVISPTDEPGDIARKRELYRRAGVPLVWWVDPDRRTVAVYRDGVLVAELGEGDALDGGEVLPGLRLPIVEIVA